MKNVGPALNRNAEIHIESGNDIIEDTAGMMRKNIVTNPLSLFVADRANW